MLLQKKNKKKHSEVLAEVTSREPFTDVRDAYMTMTVELLPSPYREHRCLRIKNNYCLN